MLPAQHVEPYIPSLVVSIKNGTPIQRPPLQIVFLRDPKPNTLNPIYVFPILLFNGPPNFGKPLFVSHWEASGQFLLAWGCFDGE